MATAQRLIFRLLHNYHFATAHLTIIYILQIDQLFHLCKSSKYLITVHRKIVCKLQIAYLEIFRRLIWLLPKVQFFGYCASYNYFAAAHLPIICPLQIDQLFQHLKSSKHLFTVHTNIIWQLQIAYLETFQRFVYCAKKNFWASAQLSFCYCASPNYLSTANRPIISPMEIV